MDRSFLNPVDEDDLYSGFNEYPSVFSTSDLQEDEEFLEAVRTSYEKRPALISRPGIATRLGTPSGYRQGTGMVSSRGHSRLHSRGNDGNTRPMTAVHGAGYTSSTSVFDPLNHGVKGSADSKGEDSPQLRVKQLEKQIRMLLDESCVAKSNGKLKVALEKAKDACKKERSMVRLQEQAGLVNGRNEDLSFSTLFNLANQYEANEMYSEALSTYQSITRNKLLPNVKRLMVNMGNIYLKMGQYPKAVKLYQMALDHVPEIYKNLRIKITHNIGLLFVKMGQYQDACTSFDYIMQEKPNFKTGLHLVLCNYALGDPESMKKAFLLMLEVTLDVDDEEKYSANSEDPGLNLLMEAIRADSLRAMEKRLKKEAETCILTAARVVAPAIASTPSEGYDWCVQALRMVAPHHSFLGNLSSSIVSSFHSSLADELEVHKVVVQLKGGEGGSLQAPVATLQAFAKRGELGRVSSIACTNLAFIHFLQGDIEQAEKYADLARQADSYNASALVNLGNCAFAKGDFEQAKTLYVCSIESNASCVEGLYNLGLVNKNQGNHEEALDCFLKLNSIVKHHPEVLYMLAHLHELSGDKEQANEWYLLLLGIVPSDPGILQKVGQLYDVDGERQLAHQYHTDSYRYYPSNLEVIKWLGSYYINMQLPEKAIPFFERAALLCPDEASLHVLVASCHRLCGNYQQALQLFRHIHQHFPEDLECLRILVRFSSELGMKEAVEYAQELKKTEKAKEVRERIGSSRPGSWRSSGRSSRVGTAMVEGDAGARPGSNRNALQTARHSAHEQHPAYSPSLTGSSDFSRPQSSVERARTSGKRTQADEDEFGDEELGVDLLPE